MGWYPAPRQKEHPPIESAALAQSIARILDDKQAENLAILDVSGPLVIADYFVIASARNTRHARALASAVDYEMKQSGRLRRNAAGVEGESNWVLLDFDDVVVHIFQAEARAFYDLESLWADVPRVEYEPAQAPADRGGGWGSIPDSTGTI